MGMGHGALAVCEVEELVSTGNMGQPKALSQTLKQVAYNVVNPEGCGIT